MGDIDTEGRQCLYASLETCKDERALLYWEEHIVSPKGGRSPEPAVGADRESDTVMAFLNGHMHMQVIVGYG